jgi:hypothetical protein
MILALCTNLYKSFNPINYSTDPPYVHLPQEAELIFHSSGLILFLWLTANLDPVRNITGLLTTMPSSLSSQPHSGAPLANTNALKRGFYTHRLKRRHLSGVETSDLNSLVAELGG